MAGVTVGVRDLAERGGDGAVEARTQQLGRALFRRLARYRPLFVESAGDRAMALLAEDARFRARLLRFIDALAGLDGDRSGVRVRRLLHEYLDAEFERLPLWLQVLLPAIRSERWPAPLVAAVARSAARTVAARFIASGGGAGALRALGYLRAHGRYPSFDVLGEYVASEQEADAYRDEYLELLRVLGRAPEAGARTAGGLYQLQVSVKLSSLTADFNPIDPAGTIGRVRPRLTAILEAARRQGIGVTLDMERYETRDLVQQIFFEVFRRGERFGAWDGIGVVLQAYLRDADAQAAALIAFAAERGTPFGVRLVKGAYWDYETVVARANGWPSPVWEEKAETDRCFERLTARLLDAYPHVRLAVASHNLRSHAQAEALREARGLPVGAVEHQTLFRTAEGATRALAAMGWPVRDYVPLGELLPGMAYLVRRILENSSQAGFLLQSRTGLPVEHLLAPPVAADSRQPPVGHREANADSGTQQSAPSTQHFRNHPPRRLFLAEDREAFAAALAAVRGDLGQEYPLRLGGTTVRARVVKPVRNPSHPGDPPVGLVHYAEGPHVARALDLATSAAPAWAARPLGERAAILRRAADLLAGQRDRTAAWMVYEAAKSWVEALADVDEAIDYLRFYALAAESLAPHWSPFGPRGVVAVIPPWNFPLAIPCGMTSAALVAGNTVVLKPAEQTPLIARRLVELLHEAGVPEDALIWLPGDGESAGAALVASPLVDMVAFTGSRTVGTTIYREGSRVQPVRGGLRATVAEMGGKNAVLVFPDADLDEAVVGILRSAFGHANQKCSAASRVLVHREIYPRLRRRLVEGARSLVTGPADEPGTLITPLIDEDARGRVLHAGEIAKTEGRVLLDNLTRPAGRSYPEVHRSAHVTPAGSPRPRGIEPGQEPDGAADSPAVSTLLGPELVEIDPASAGLARTTQEEIFGPVLALIPFIDEAEAVCIANGTRYALTGGIFSRSPGTVTRMVAALDAGNLYVNRPITGARVGVEPFGGHRLSGTGPKAGGAEYLWAFVTGRAGYRRGEALPRGTARIEAETLDPWAADAAVRAEAVRAALALLDGEWGRRWQEAIAHPHPSAGASAGLAVAERLVERLAEVAAPDSTAPLPGQQTTVQWETPRGCGLVIVDAGAPTENLLALIVAPLLAGNALLVLPDGRRRALVELLLAAFHQSGVPETAILLAPEDLDLAAAVALPNVTFAAIDTGHGQARALYRLLGTASAAPESTHLKALISLVDGPAPDQPGFLRRFALPKTVAIQTLHLGADLELLAGAGE